MSLFSYAKKDHHRSILNMRPRHWRFLVDIDCFTMSAAN